MQVLTPGERVAAVYELLEMILLQLSLKDLLRSQATSKTFKLLFDSSALLRAKFAIPFSTQLANHKWVRHPMLPKELHHDKELDIWTTRTMHGGIFTARLFFKKGSEDLWSCPASWKSFWACRPATRSMRASSGCSTVFGSSSAGLYRYYRCDHGITLGQLVAAALEIKELAGVNEAIVHFDTRIEVDGSDVYDAAAAAGYIDCTF